VRKLVVMLAFDLWAASGREAVIAAIKITTTDTVLEAIALVKLKMLEA